MMSELRKKGREGGSPAEKRGAGARAEPGEGGSGEFRGPARSPCLSRAGEGSPRRHPMPRRRLEG